MDTFLEQIAALSPSLPFIAKALLVLLIARVAVYWLLALRRAREGVRHFARNVLYVGGAIYLVVLGFWSVTHIQNGSPTAPIMFISGIVFLGFGVSFLQKSRPARKRAIPRHVREAVKARDLGNEPFDPSKHHIDHIWPFSLGGSHTIDNLRVIAKGENLRKGAKRPRFSEMW